SPDVPSDSMLTLVPAAAGRETGEVSRRPRSARGMRSAVQSALVDAGAEEPAGRDLRQLVIGVGLLPERGSEQILHRRGELELPREGLGRAVAGDLVVLDPLGRGDDAGVLRGSGAGGPHDLVALRENPLHALTRLRRRVRLAELGEHLLEPR